MNTTNIGKFDVSMDLIEREPRRIAEIFSLIEFCPVRAECMLVRRTVEYVGYSPRFDPVEPHMMTPEYTLTIKQSKYGNIELVEVRRNG